MTDTPTVEQRHRDAAAALIDQMPRDYERFMSFATMNRIVCQAFARFEASLTQQPRPDAGVDGLADEVRRKRSLMGNGTYAAVFFTDDLILRILAALKEQP